MSITTTESIGQVHTDIDNNITDIDPFASMSDEAYLSGNWKTHVQEVSKPNAEVPTTTEVADSKSTQQEVSNETEEDGDKKEDIEDTEDEDAISFQQAFDIVFKNPIKATGVSLKIESMEEAIRLIQQGTDYTRKMQDLSKQKAKISLLEVNGLLTDPEALPRMIEAFKGDPDAIKDLVAKFDIDVTAKSVDTYKPKIAERTVSELAFSDTIDTLKSNGTFEAVNDAFEGFVSFDDGKGHSEDSRAILTQNPNLLARLGDDIKDGSYNKVQNELAIRKMKGTYMHELPAIVNYGVTHNEMFQNSAKQSTPKVKSPKAVSSTLRGSGNDKPIGVTKELLLDATAKLAGMSDDEYRRIYGK